MATINTFTEKQAQIENLAVLPDRIKQLIQSAESINTFGFQTIRGYNGRNMTFDALGFWKNDNFKISSIAGVIEDKQLVWAGGQVLESPVK